MDPPAAATSSALATRSPLPPAVRDAILAHLVPPRPPLPAELLSRDFLERLAFLPPGPLDTDAQLSPFPAPAPNALADALASCELATPTDTQYNFAGTMLARTLVQPAALERKVEVSFESEPERGWVYRGAKFSIGEEDDGWYDDIEEVPMPEPEQEQEEDEARAYWAGWSSTSDGASTQDQEQEDEDAYWAQYGAGPDTSAHDEPYRAPSPPPPTEPAVAQVTEQLSSLSPTSSTPSSAEASLLEEKLTAKIKCQLLKAWTQFSAGADPESAVIHYLRVCREVNNRPAWGFVSTDAAPEDDAAPGGDVKEEVLRTRVESVRDIFEVLARGKDEFWRWCEEAIRVRAPPPQDGPEDTEGC